MSKGDTFPDRNVMHKWMGPQDSCDVCYGRGWRYAVVEGTENDYIPDAHEVFCECPCGVLRRQIEGGDETPGEGTP